MGKTALKDISTRAPKDFDKEETKQKLHKLLDELDELQNLLFAEHKHAVLIVIQGMDASGKDGLIRDVFTSMNPEGVLVKAYKAPTEEELSHDFLWRIHQHSPAKGMIQIFNRSHYEDVLITRVHQIIDDKDAKKRMKAINDFEQLLTEHNNTVVLKFYLHVSPEEQQERLQERTRLPQKMWKYSKDDINESKHWDKYMECYEEVFERCDDIPWHIIPADQNWYKSYLVALRLRDTLKSLKMEYPKLEE
jgi:PPK2 family polyphosphate:nucleotide phosphotransferase